MLWTEHLPAGNLLSTATGSITSIQAVYVPAEVAEIGSRMTLAYTRHAQDVTTNTRWGAFLGRFHLTNDDVYGSLCRRLFGGPHWVLSSRIKLEQPGPTYFKETDDLKSMLRTELKKSGKLLQSAENALSRRPACN
jgi:hypothetical protein